MKRSLCKRLVVLALLVVLVPMLVCAAGQKDQATQKKPIEIMGPFGGPDEVAFQEVLAAFKAKTGIDVYYTADPEFNTQIMVRTQAGNPPAIAAVPQPGTMATLASRGYLKPLPKEVIAQIDSNYAPVWKSLGSYESNVYGLFYRVNAKSFVWYPKKAFNAHGYTIPNTWNELITLMDTMVADGITPWSIGIEAGGATGWLATDWLEDLVLRTAGPNAYDKWINNELKFDSPEIKKAMSYMESIWMNPKYVFGGPAYIRGTSIGDAIRPLFQNPPQAMLHRQGNFILNDVPSWVAENLDEEVGVFTFPSIDPQWGKPVFGGGDQFVIFDDSEDVVTLLKFLGSWEGARSWAQTGTALFPHKDQDLKDYPSKIMQDLASSILNAQVFRFDASDMMPAEIGAGAFWEGMANFVTGVPAATVLSEIQGTWDSIKR
ncbi:MAG: ABC transporter substrate-binding protein [Sphaerochaeta sp.]|nr:ABC transporter substrate-binding protein [Sphaerochaeta sp.]